MPDLIVVGSGLGGLCAAAIACRHGLEVLVLEAHSQPGGAAHGFRRGPFHFESGPSLWSGLGRWPSANPLAQVLRAVDESVPVARYSEWGLLLPEGNLRVGVGLEPFLELLRSLRGPAVADEWQAFLLALAPLCRAAGSLPLLALRPGAGMFTTLGSQGFGLIGQAGQLAALGGGFGPIARRHLQDPFLLHGLSPMRGWITRWAAAPPWWRRWCGASAAMAASCARARRWLKSSCRASGPRG
jgi:phytoene dehydrogenase-like protein